MKTGEEEERKMATCKGKVANQTSSKRVVDEGQDPTEWEIDGQKGGKS